jgi:hypothetical protein
MLQIIEYADKQLEPGLYYEPPGLSGEWGWWVEWASFHPPASSFNEEVFSSHNIFEKPQINNKLT